MKAIELSSRSRKVVVAAMGVAGAALMLILVWAIVTSAVKSSEVRATQEDRLPQAEQNDRTFDLLQDCVAPGGKCYRRSLRQTAGAVGDLTRVIVLTSACAGELPYGLTTDERVERLTDCVTERLSRRPNR